MGFSRRVGPPIVSAAVATLVLTNFAMVLLAERASHDGHLFGAIWPIALTSTVAVVMVMSFLFKSIVEMGAELERREAEAQHQALHDQLTGLANRALLEDRLGQALCRYRRSGESVALLMLDLDRFKQVNDTLGHNAGDDMVRQVAERLRGLLRDSDTVARIGGDEFAIIQARPRGEVDVRRLCERIIETVGEPYRLGEREARVGVSIGAVFAGPDMVTATDLLRKADITMYRAKAAGRHCFRIFTDAMDADVQRRDRIETILRAELAAGGGPELHFQPVIGGDGKVASVEGLMRWDQAVLGPIAPAEIVPVAEECGLIEQLGFNMVRRACALARRFPELSVSINLSPAQFRSGDFPEALRRLVAGEGVPCNQLELEVTEQLFIDHGGLCEPALHALREAGFRICLDDFGTGYSSLSCLRRFPVDTVKLDHSFVDIAARDQSVALIRAAVTLGHAMNMEVIAEGVSCEAEEQIALEAGCDGLQGHLYARAMPTDQLESWLADMRKARISDAA
ncbi:EAL domain-containing protein [Sphingosinicella sp. YJ22]|uniref:putative bifunctional diguanylate cyclase/phosphodiesterase n=1 Tax=Sphingosinicella sp. YJ22 TaxID=1104780 RepID=UPI00140D1216|nr:EAL domain-containing protein [Sphingosinicella sp. YJ22]